MTKKKLLLPPKELLLLRKWVLRNGGGYREYLAATRLNIDDENEQKNEIF